MNKRIIINVTVILLLICNFTKAAENDTIKGLLGEANNPCDTSPCIPGLVYSIKTDSVEYIITINNSWQWVNDYLIISTDTIYLGDSLQINGEITKKQDINTNEFYELNVNSVIILNTKITSLIDSNKIIIYQSLDNNSVIINSFNSRINSIVFFDIQGHCIYTKKQIFSNFFQSENINTKGLIVVYILFDTDEVITYKIILK